MKALFLAITLSLTANVYAGCTTPEFKVELNTQCMAKGDKALEEARMRIENSQYELASEACAKAYSAYFQGGIICKMPENTSPFPEPVIFLMLKKSSNASKAFTALQTNNLGKTPETVQASLERVKSLARAELEERKICGIEAQAE